MPDPFGNLALSSSRNAAYSNPFGERYSSFPAYKSVDKFQAHVDPFASIGPGAGKQDPFGASAARDVGYKASEPQKSGQPALDPFSRGGEQKQQNPFESSFKTYHSGEYGANPFGAGASSAEKKYECSNPFDAGRATQATNQRRLNPFGGTRDDGAAFSEGKRSNPFEGGGRRGSGQGFSRDSQERPDNGGRSGFRGGFDHRPRDDFYSAERRPRRDNDNFSSNFRDEPQRKTQYEPFVVTRTEEPLERNAKFDFYQPLTYRYMNIEEFNKENRLSYFSTLEQLPPMREFSDLLPAAQLEFVKTQLKYATPTPIYQVVFPMILQGRDIISIAKTGSGKTFIFSYAASVHCCAQPRTLTTVGQPICIVISPTRELAIYTYAEFNKISKLQSRTLNVACIYGGYRVYEYQNAIMQRLPLDVLIATPGRLQDFYYRGVLSFQRVSFVVLDEADEMLNFGFKPYIDFMFQRSYKPVYVAMFSATWPQCVYDLAKQYMAEERISMVKIDSDMPLVCRDVTQRIIITTEREKMGLLQQTLKEHDGKAVLIFVNNKVKSYQLQSKIPGADAISSDFTQYEREMKVRYFKAKQINVLISTNLLARGIDIDQLDLVINYDMPSDICQYVHRCGRTGRANRAGLVISFFDKLNDIQIVPELYQQLVETGQDVSAEFLEVAKSFCT